MLKCVLLFQRLVLGPMNRAAGIDILHVIHCLCNIPGENYFMCYVNRIKDGAYSVLRGSPARLRRMRSLAGRHSKARYNILILCGIK